MFAARQFNPQSFASHEDYVASLQRSIETADRSTAFFTVYLPAIAIAVVAALLITVCVIYLVQHFKNRGKPPVERKGANLLGGAYGNGAVGGKPTGAGAFGGVPGVSIPVSTSKGDASEDPRRK